jgi:hypothetical protein
MSVTINASTSSGLISSADTSGTIELQSDGTTQLTVASGGVTVAGLTTTGTTSLSNLTATGTFGGGVITSGTAVASTSGTSIDFTSIPSWVKRVTVMLNEVSTNGTSSYLVQLGDSGGIETTGYVSTGTGTTGDVGGTVSSTAGYIVRGLSASAITSGQMVITLLGSNQWCSSHVLTFDSTAMQLGAGSKTLSDTLTQVRITTVNGTDTFDAGTINILYE